MWSRRQFITAVGFMGGAMIAPACGLDRADEVEGGEVFGGFVLLPEGAPVPSYVQAPRLPMPILCGVGVDRGGPELTGISTAVRSGVDLARLVSFPVYDLKALTGFSPSGGELIQHPAGEVFASALGFARRLGSGEVEINVALWTYPDFPRPFPLWSSEPVEPGGPAVVLERVDFLPAPSVMVRSASGYVFHWIERDVLHMMTVDNELSPEAPSLSEVIAWIQNMVPVLA